MVDDDAASRGASVPPRPLTRKFQSRPGGAWETTRKRGLYRRLTLRRADGEVYLNRWGIGHDRVGGVLLHRMDAPDPGVDLHDHPWWFVSIILWRLLGAPCRHSHGSHARADR